MRVALLAGGTGGAKLAVGLRDLLHGHDDEPAQTPGQLSVIANTADDIEIYDVHVSPDPDLITFRLAGVIGEHGYGIANESHTQMDARRAAGEEVWFELGDEDMELCEYRARLQLGGATPTAAQERATSRYDLGGARLFPMSNQPVRTVVETPAGARGIQQFLIQDRGAAEIRSVNFNGVESARPTIQVRRAIESADLVVVGPSNPVISIAPILSLAGMTELLQSASAPVLGVSPIVGGKVLKGPTAAFLSAAGFAADTSGVADYYAANFPDVIDAWIGDDPALGHPHHLAEVEMSDPAATRDVAAEVLRYGASLAPAPETA